MTPKALKFVRYDRIEDHYRQGWVMSFPNAWMHHHNYGAELAWICDCPIPGLKDSVHRVPPDQNNKGREDERILDRP